MSTEEEARVHLVDAEVDADYGHKTVCRCGESVRLHLNGGELDGLTCKCGRRHELQSTGTDYVVLWGPA